MDMCVHTELRLLRCCSNLIITTSGSRFCAWRTPSNLGFNRIGMFNRRDIRFAWLVRLRWSVRVGAAFGTRTGHPGDVGGLAAYRFVFGTWKFANRIL